ncbi:unnamed protein product [Sphenostylis stenocarpa]|uniref:Uncharacterized protein n=1 Tax=Sphenostylis stenocarpa TaxID=92480 RepID=A0AA87BAJ3_9FABA|nr:unnamed protein product [Sphenostylis stenocarpa]
MWMKFLASLILLVWLSTATPSLAQYVIDTNGEQVDNDEEYYIKPAITDNGGRFTLINRNETCPLYVGLENTDLPLGYPVKFTHFAVNIQDEDIGVNRDLKVEFKEVSSTCVQSTEWRVGENETRSGRRPIITGQDDSAGLYGNYFRIVETESAGIYNFQWCPTELCSTCGFVCSSAGILRENGKILFALDAATPLPVVFQKKDD